MVRGPLFSTNMNTSKTGILLINLGTPQAPNKLAVRRFLREFLSDPHVITLSQPLRWLLVNGIILPFRTRWSTQAYQKIWSEQGSPLLIHSRQLQNALQEILGSAYDVALAMRYGKPGIASAIDHLIEKNCDRLMVVPLYPQYSKSTSESSIQKTKKIITKRKLKIPVTFLKDFYDHSEYIKSSAQLIKNTLKNQPIEKIIFSYHGLPEHHIHTICYEKKHCDLKKPCPAMANHNRDCYRAQCYTTSRLIAEKLGLQSNEYKVTFQSRLGKTPWITPYTDHLLNQLAEEGLKNIAIVCPSFVADCLETLEEIDIRAQQQWKSLGGEKLIRVPCLNANNTWVNALATMIR